MSDLLVGLLSALIATNQPAAISNAVRAKTGISVNVPDKNDPVERDYLKLLAEDDAAQEEVDKWIKENQQFKSQGADLPAATLNARIKQRFEPVHKAYEGFLQRHPKHARALLAYGSFLNDIGDEAGAETQWEKAREADPTNPATWNNLANHYGHRSPVAKAFEYYQKAIELAPDEPIYFQNFATTVYLFRHDATNYFKITEQQVFDKAMALYRRAQELDPQNFLLATDVAQTYYGIKPRKTGDVDTDSKAAQKLAEEAVASWNVALKLARDDIERQGIHVHLARVQINAGRFAEARQNLNAATHEMFADTKQKLMKKLTANEEKAKGTNAPGANKFQVPSSGLRLPEVSR